MIGSSRACAGAGIPLLALFRHPGTPDQPFNSRALDINPDIAICSLGPAAVLDRDVRKVPVHWYALLYHQPLRLITPPANVIHACRWEGFIEADQRDSSCPVARMI
jgi:hypothetical protein